MKVITIDSDAYKTLVRKIDKVYNFIKEQGENTIPPPPDPATLWVSNEEAAELLGVSKRTMQRLRSRGETTYSICGGKVRYTLSEVWRLMSGRVVASKYKQEADLLRAHQERRAKKVNNKSNI